MYVDLANSNSKITYKVTISNSSSKYFTVGDISVSSTNSNIKYIFDGVEKDGVYQGESYSFLINVYISTSSCSGDIPFKFGLKTIDDSLWTYSDASSYSEFVSLYNASYKIEAWGAQGGKVTSENYGSGTGGAGGYVSGNLRVLKNNKLYIYIWGIGENSDPTSRSKILISGGYNGGCSNGGFDALSPSGGGGGSSFVLGCSTCDAVDEDGVHTGQANHFSGYVFSDIRMINGTNGMPSHDGLSSVVGNLGNGFVKITLIPAN